MRAYAPEEIVQLLNELFTVVLDGRNSQVTHGVQDALGWAPSRDVATIVGDIHRWIIGHEAALRPILA
jgi:hypothetical protein